MNKNWIDKDALEVVRRLQEKGFTTYLVGGCVRDILAGYIPKDFDIATMARPNEVKRIIPKSYIIGRRFRLVLVKRGEELFEVATFRRNPENNDETELGDNIFGTPMEDARRRDFTINSMYYDPKNDEIIDYCKGLDDVREGVIRIIGDPKTRLVEDPIRIFRALRLAHKLKFSIEPELRKTICEFSSELPNSVLPRRREELLKILRLPDIVSVIFEARDLNIVKYSFPTLDQALKGNSSDALIEYLYRAHRLISDPKNPVELFSGLLLAFVRSTFLPDPQIPVTIKSLLEHPTFSKIAKDEFGMFNMEIRLVAAAIHLQNSLLNFEKYQKRGARRLRAVSDHPSFPLALKIAQLDHAISEETILKWETFYLRDHQEHSNQLAFESSNLKDG